MIPDAAPLKITPLFDAHRQLSAQMGPFAGWNMPIQYEGILAEARHTRRAASCFDICHMGEFLVEGDAQTSGLERLVAAKVAGLPVGRCRYSSMLNDAGGVIDDLVLFRRSQKSWMIVVNAATLENDKKHFLRRLLPGARFQDLSHEWGKIDLQGPQSRDVLTRLIPEAAHLKYYAFAEVRLLGAEAFVSRTGYTGELGFEIYLPREKVPVLWEELLADARVRPAGLGARDVLRLEMGYSLYGQDIDETTTPLEAGLEQYIDLSKDFIGQPALLKQKNEGIPRRRVYCASLSRRSPRHGHKIFIDGQEAGVITSGTFSPHVNTGIGMGFARAELATGQKIMVGDAAPAFEAVICDRPFVKETSLKA